MKLQNNNFFNSPIVHFMRNVFTAVPNKLVREVALLLKSIYAQDNREDALAKAQQVTAKLEAMKLGKATGIVHNSVDDTLTFYAFPREHWLRIRTNNMLDRIMCEIRRRTNVVGCFPDGNLALMLAAVRLRHIAGTQWSTARYLNMKHLGQQTEEVTISMAG
jgi:putative transposase